MSATEAANTLDGRAVSQAEFYAVTCDPARHVVVEACAGAGKTWLLVSRIVRALLDGAKPQEILAITFTRKAAGEMRERLSQWLQAFAEMTPAQAAAELRVRGLGESEAHARAPALMQLMGQVLASDRPVQLRTFHGWFTQLLQAAPLELLQQFGLPADVAVLEDDADLRPQWMRRLRRRVHADAALRAAWQALTERHGRHKLEEWLSTVRARSLEIALADAAGVLEGSVQPASALFAECADASPPCSALRRAPFVAQAQAVARALAAGGKRAQDAAEGLAAALHMAGDELALDAFRAALFTTAGTPRKLGEMPGLAELVTQIERIGQAQAQQQAHEDHGHMVLLARALLAEFAALKRERRLVDMNDLERIAHTMLSDPVLSGWVQERLDWRVKHLLIDEFQDTSPLQWQALHAWLSSYAGASAEGPRLFIVGDPKQSIYRFRRAEPRVFLAAQAFVREGLGGTLAACDHTRRCAPGVVRALNTVFAAWAEDVGLPWRDHTTQRGPVDEATPAALGLIDGAPRPERQSSNTIDAAAAWRPSLTVPRSEPETLRREVEATRVAQAIAQLVREEGVPAEHIFVLARRRAPLVLAARALAACGVPHVAPEDWRLAELSPVQDLLAVMDVLASPSQSISLARFLKSPLIGADEDDLQALAQAARSAPRGPVPWFEALCQRCPARPALERAREMLLRWRATAAVWPPHDLLQQIVDDSDALGRLAATAPPSQAALVAPAIEALLAAALALDEGRFVTLYGFVRALRQRSVKAPAGMAPGAVQLLTIHGAKGLEAHTVFVMDADPERQNAEQSTVLTDWPVDAAAPRRLAFVASESQPPQDWQGHVETERQARAREEANALYVAMTRAETQLVFSRTEAYNKPSASSWWARVQALATLVEIPLTSDEATSTAPVRTVSVPAWPDGLNRPLAEPEATSDEDRTAAIGRAVHRLLEWATSARAVPAAQEMLTLSAAAAKAFGVADASEVHRVACTILASPDCAPFFDAARLAWAGNEVPVRGADGQVLRIDRLVQLSEADSTWWVLDYKLSGDPLHDPEMREQLRSYCDAVRLMEPGARVRGAFITQTGVLQVMDAA